MHPALLFTVCLPLVSGAMVQSRNTCKTFDDNYDDFTALPASVVDIAEYNGLLYQDWRVGNRGSPLGPVMAHTKPNAIAAGINTDLTSGDVALSPFGAVLRGQGTKAFNLNSFYFGCAQLTAQATADIARGCVVSLTGFDVNDRRVAVATFAFASTGVGIAVAPILATVPTRFTNLKNVTFGIASSDAVGGAAGTVLVVDDIVHCNFS